MKEAIFRFLSPLFSIDIRALALFRVVFGLVCIVDVIRRWPWIELFYSNNGLWSNHFALYSNTGNPIFSLMWALSTPAEASFFFGLTIICLSLFVVGYRTKLFQILSAVGMLSIINRNPHLVYGGDSVIIVLFAWTFFMPLGRAWSVDAKNSSSQSDVFVSLSVFALYLQIAAIYLLSGIQKTGSTWNDGSSVYYLLQQDRIITYFGELVRGRLPYSVTEMLSWYTIGIEHLAPFLILSPIASKWCKKLAVILLGVLHVGIAVFVNLGVFSFVMLSAITLLVPFKKNSLSKPEKIKSYFFIREGLAVFILFIAILHAGVSNTILHNKITKSVPFGVLQLIDYTSFRQGWGMFSPSVTREDVHLVIDIEMKDETHIDPRTGAPPYFGPTISSYAPRHQLWDVYTTELVYDKNSPLLAELGSWLRNRQKGVEVETWQYFTRAKVWGVIDSSPEPGRGNIGIVFKKDLLLSVP